MWSVERFQEEIATTFTEFLETGDVDRAIQSMLKIGEKLEETGIEAKVDGVRTFNCEDAFEATMVDLRYRQEDLDIQETFYPFAMYYDLLAQLYIEAGKLDMAHNVLFLAMMWNPMNFDTLETLMMLERDLGMEQENWRGVIDIAHLAAATKEDLAVVYMAYFELFREVGEYDLALASLRKSAQYADYEDVDQVISFIYENKDKLNMTLREKDFDDLLEQNDIMLGAAPDIIDVTYDIGVKFYEEGQYDYAFQLLQINYELTDDQDVDELLMEINRRMMEEEPEGTMH